MHVISYPLSLNIIILLLFYKHADIHTYMYLEVDQFYDLLMQVASQAGLVISHIS